MNRYAAAVASYRWLLTEVIQFDDILRLPAFRHLESETAGQVLEAAGDFIANVIAPINEASDRVGATFRDGQVFAPPGWKEAYAAWREGGWPGLSAPLEHGGQAMPFTLQACVATMLGGADLGFAMVAVAARAASSVLRVHGAFEGAPLFIQKLVSGEWAATIVITESRAGSDVGLLSTKAVRKSADRFSITGSKIFISGGDLDLVDQILHLVLARSESASKGTAGLSLFLVPKKLVDEAGRLGASNGVSVARIEEKMGLHGSATCVLDFQASEGILIGREGEGLQALFTMMNEMRLEVALSAIGICTSATQCALDYASERRQGRNARGQSPAPIIDHADVQRMISVMQIITEGGRALVMETARLIDLSAHAVDESIRSSTARIAGWLLPICKATLSDGAVEVASLGIQVRGGHGYVRESGVEQFMRDARILPIYEGTNGIQAIDLATRKLRRDQGSTYRSFADLVRADITRSTAAPDVDDIRRAAQRAVDVLDRVSDVLMNESTPTNAVLWAASSYMDLAGRACLAWMWLKMATAEAVSQAMSFEKRQLAHFYCDYFEPEFELHAARIQRAVLRSQSSL